MVRAILLAAAVLSAPAAAQDIVTSSPPERVAVTIYRDSDRGLQPMNLGWLGGYALVSETRHIRIPAGVSEVRFEGVTSGIVPQSAIVTGLGEAVLEKNRDARLLSPGAFLDASLGQRLLLRRTSKATGKVREEEAIVRATSDGVVLQTPNGIEALRCSGLAETLLAHQIPQGLSAKPTLSVMVRSPVAVERDVTLSYISNNFDWQADYVAELALDGQSLSLFAWMTVANGDDTALANANTQAVAGKLNRQRVWVSRGEAKPITLNCWPQGTTSDLPDLSTFDVEQITVTGMRAPPPPAPPPPPAMAAERDNGYVAQEERLGDVRLYRVPIQVTVAARSQKQVALLRRPKVRFSSFLRLRPDSNDFDQPLERVLVADNRDAAGLGIPLPAGHVALFGSRAGRRILLGEGTMDDHAVGERVEIALATPTGVRAHQVTIGRSVDGRAAYRLTLTSDSAESEPVKVELPLVAKPDSTKLTEHDGWQVWSPTIRPNGRVELEYHY